MKNKRPNIGKILTTLREKRELTLAEVASKAGLSTGSMSKLENDPSANPSINTLYALADAYEVAIADLLAIGGSPTCAVCRGMRDYFDTLVINGGNIGEIRRRFLIPGSSKWNAFIRDETAKREVPNA